MMVKGSSSPQQQPLSQIILGVLDSRTRGDRARGGAVQLVVVSVKANEETIVVEVADEVPQDRDRRVQMPIKVESWGQEVALVTEKGDEIST